MRKIQPLIEVNVLWEKEIPRSEIIMFLQNHVSQLLYNLPLPMKRHRVFSRNIQ